MPITLIARLQEQVQSLRDRNLNLQQGKERLQGEVNQLTTENEGLKKRLQEAETKIGGVLGGADQDMIEVNGNPFALPFNRDRLPELFYGFLVLCSWAEVPVGNIEAFKACVVAIAEVIR